MLKLYEPRFIEPTLMNNYWIHTTRGGLNECLLIGKGSTLPNCVGYAWGRWYELLGKRPNLHKGNAENWWLKTDGYERGEFPKLGAIACWRKGLAMNSTDGAGHVAVVEDILPNGEIVTSNSNYLGTRFYMRTIKPPFNIGASYTFQGFIYLPVEFSPFNPIYRKSLDLLAEEVIAGLWGNGADRKAKITTAGYDFNRVQERVNYLIASKKITPKKSIDEIAKEVIAGKWGNGYSRHINLMRSGYKYVEVQKRVNQLLAIKRALKPIDVIARQVIAGKWGNGLARKQALIEAGYNYNEVQMVVNKLLK